MEFPRDWSSPGVKTELQQVQHYQTNVAPAPCRDMGTGMKRGSEPLEVECYDTTIPHAVTVKQEPRESGSKAGIGEVTIKARNKAEALAHEETDIKTELSESTSTKQQTEDLNDDFWDDIPVFYGKCVNEHAHCL